MRTRSPSKEKLYYEKNVFLSCLSVAVLALSFFALVSCDNWKDGWEDEWSPEDNYPARSFVSPFYMGSSEGMVATNPIKCSWTGGNFSSVKEFAASDRVTSEFLDIETAYTWWTEPASVPGFSLSVSADTKKCDFAGGRQQVQGVGKGDEGSCRNLRRRRSGDGKIGV